MVSMALSFTPLSIDGAGEYRRLYSLCSRKSSYYSFGSLWAWRNIYGLSWAFEEGLCWIRTEKGVLWGPVGPWDEIPWAELMPRLFPGPETFRFVPDGLAHRLKEALGGRIQAINVRSQWEYIHSVKDLIALRGNRFSKKRSHFRQFMKHYSFTYRSLGPEDGEAVLEAQRRWLQEREPSGALLRENEAIEEMVREWKAVPSLLGGLIEVKGVPVAYTIAEGITDHILVIHFEKALSAYNGGYQAINRLFLQKTASSYTLVNREEDLGDKGMRVAKMSYNPVDFLRKYVLSWDPS